MATKDISDYQVCLAVAKGIARHRLGGGKPLQREDYACELILSEMTGEHPNVCWRALERALKRGLIEYGVSMSSSWLTPKGIEFLGCTIYIK